VAHCGNLAIILRSRSVTARARPERPPLHRPLRRSPANWRHVAQTNSTVLLLGETGSGKEVLAQAIHDASGRKDRPMIKVNCAALPASLIESELFGREKGAFTGTLARQASRFEIADGSTIFRRKLE
jgi:formate hydrogenlyase transcriptional activator